MEKSKGLEYYAQEISLRGEDDAGCVSLIPRSSSEEALTMAQVDVLKEHPEATEVLVGGLDQETFEYFVDTYGQQFRVIHFWKCPLITDFSRLERLTQVEYLLFFWNQRVSHLWDMSRNVNLKGISFDDFTRLRTLEEIPLAPGLEELYFGDRIWNAFVAESLKPLAGAKMLRILRFTALRIVDNDITPLAEIPNLEVLEFPPRLFTIEQVAWLTSRLPHVQSSVLCPYLRLDSPFDHEGLMKDVLVIGKGKPFLNSYVDQERLEKYENQFSTLVQQYTQEPSMRLGTQY